MVAEKKISLRCIGRRMMSTEKLSFAFQDSKGEVLFFTKIKWAIIGRSYFATKKGDTIEMLIRPDEDEQAVQASEDQMTEWQVADSLARDMQKRKSLSAKMDKMPPALERAVNAIRPLIKGLDFGRRRQLVEILMTKASKGKDGWAE